MRANLLRSVSHDIRTPLTSILGSSSALTENSGLSEEDRAELAREIHKDAQWLVRVTENILSVTKFSGSDVHLRKEEEAVEEIIGSAIGKFRKTYGSMPIRVDRPDTTLFVPMDATLIEQVFLNLFENAVLHGKTTRSITVRIMREPSYVCFSVEDDGQGIDPLLLPRIFDEYFSSSSERTDERRSMGIGLSVCRAIIHAHGGDIIAYNNRQGGASIRFRLPYEENINEY